MPERTEAELIQAAQAALSSCNWTVGECAAEWCKKYSKGRTDADFGNLVGLSGDQVFQRRRVWETFADVYESYGNLKWSHFFVALTWEDSAECLAWADEQAATVAEMKAWRRMQHGEDLLAPAGEDDGDGVSDTFRKLATDDGGVAAQNGGSEDRPEQPDYSDAARFGQPTMATIGTAEPTESYAPFNSRAATATKPRAEDDAGDGAARDALLIRKTCNAVDIALKRSDDTRQFIIELLAQCLRSAPGGTAEALKEFLQAHPKLS